jgi:hypothetical protein
LQRKVGEVNQADDVEREKDHRRADGAEEVLEEVLVQPHADAAARVAGVDGAHDATERARKKVEQPDEAEQQRDAPRPAAAQVLELVHERHQPDEQQQRRQQIRRRAKGEEARVGHMGTHPADEVVDFRVRLGGVGGHVVLVEGELRQQQQHGGGEQHEAEDSPFAARGRRLLWFRVVLPGHARRLGKQAGKGQRKNENPRRPAGLATPDGHR